MVAQGQNRLEGSKNRLPQRLLTGDTQPGSAQQVGGEDTTVWCASVARGGGQQTASGGLGGTK